MTKLAASTNVQGASISLFIKSFVRHGKRVASFAPSSRALANAATRHVRRDQPQTILELGAGTGAITAIALEKMHPESTLIALEIDRLFARILTARCPRATVRRCDARQLPQILAELHIDHIDLLVNGMPTPSLPPSVNEVVFDVYQRLAPDAYFSQITVMPWIYLPLYSRLFHAVKFHLVPANFPPGGAYHCQGLRADYTQHLPGRKAALRRMRARADAHLRSERVN